MNYNFSDLCNVDSEKYILGAITVKPAVIYDIREKLQPNDFSRQVYRLIYESMLNMAMEQKPIDFVTITEQMRRDGNLEKCGGLSAVVGIISCTPTASGVSNHVQIVADYAKRRKVIELAENTVQKAIDISTELDVSDIQKQLTETVLPSTSDKLVSMKQTMIDFTEWLNQRKMNNEFNGVLSGIPTLDELTQGFEAGKLIIIAARPSMGKTALAGQIVANAVAKQGKHVLFFSLEMERYEILSRMLAMETQIDASVLTGPQELTTNNWTSVFTACSRMRDWPLVIDTDRRQTPAQMIAKARAMQATEGLDMIVIDYIQLMSDGLKHRGDNRVQEISNISRELKIMAGQFKVPVIALSQLSRGVEARNDKRPMLSDLRDSGSIEQDADMVLMLYRDKYYNDEADDVTELLLKKNRGGKIGTVRTLFRPGLTKFEALADEQYNTMRIPQSAVPY